LARTEALKELYNISSDNSQSKEAFREDLMNIARTTISSKLLTYEKEHFAKLVVDAVLKLNGSRNLSQIQIIKKLGGSLKDSYLDDGFILEKQFQLDVLIGRKNHAFFWPTLPWTMIKSKYSEQR